MNNDNTLIPKYRFPEFKNDNFILTTLKDLGEFQRGISYKPENVSNQGTLVLRSGNIQENKIDIRKDLVYVTKFIKPELLLKSNDIVICMSNGSKSLVGKSAEFIVNNTIGDVTVGAFCSFYRPKNEIVKYILQLPEFHKYVQLKLGGGNINNLKNTDLESFSALISSNPTEQQKIAACLSSLDDVIAGHEEKLTTLEEHKKGLLQNLFPQEGATQPKYRFPEFENDGDWVEKTIIDTADKNIKWCFTGGPFGSNLKSSDYTSSGIRIIQLQNIGDGIFNDEYKIYTSLEKADELLSCNIYSGDIILSKMGDPVGRACIMPGDNERFVMASDGIRLAVNEKEFSKYFIFSLINSDIIRTKIEAKSTGSTRKRIGLDVLKQIPLLIPKTLNEQQKIASVLSSIDELIIAQREKIEALKEHKKGLMQGLFPKIES
ncbi:MULTISPECIES: restriction endonuclease subunit S [unclassified Empedobacter]|uniref:restriction endonuclease subunit S n=1 Tax=unclassified Empedobacter TaxID=2643773 RepID=UPI0025BB207B|nr:MULTISPECIES: restriction endonuclease subunit S [unclassified Empedobacter]